MIKPKKHAVSQPERQAIMVLGMHRSGTSVLSGLLMRLGASGPLTLLGASDDNPLGHFEPRALHRLHDDLLASAGTSWDDYKPFSESWLSSPTADDFRDRLRLLIATEYGASNLFVVKDPRSCRLISFWRDVMKSIQIQPMFVHTHRNPLEVAQSLSQRNGFDVEYGCLLWLRYILDAEAGSRGQIRSFTSYDRLLRDWRVETEKIATDLGITWLNYNSGQLPNIAEVIRPDFKHNKADDLVNVSVIANWVRDASAIFDRWAEFGEDAKDHALLDHIHHGFDEGAEMFGSAVHRKHRTLVSERDKACREVEETMLQNAQLQIRLTERTAERDQIVTQLDLSRNMLDQRRAEIDDTVEELHKARAALIEAEERREHLTFSLDAAEKQIQVLRINQVRSDGELAKVQTAVLTYQDRTSAGAAEQRAEIAKAAEAVKKAVAAQRAEAAKAAKAVAQLNDRIAQIMASSSWRLTAPVRWVVLRLRK